MAIAGGGVPALRVSIYRRKLKQSGNAVNVPQQTVWLAEDAAAYFVDSPKAFIYVNLTEGGGTVYLAELLTEMGLIDPYRKECEPMNARTIATAIAALDKAKQLVDVATDWNLDEVEIDGEMVRTYSLNVVFDAAIKTLQADSAAAPMPIGEDVTAAIKTLCASVGRNADFDLYQAKVIASEWLDELQRKPEQDSATGDDK